MTSSTVHVVHCVDTEGPLHESIPATFERIENIFGLELEPSSALLKKLQAGEVELGGIEDLTAAGPCQIGLYIKGLSAQPSENVVFKNITIEKAGKVSQVG